MQYSLCSRCTAQRSSAATVLLTHLGGGLKTQPPGGELLRAQAMGREGFRTGWRPSHTSRTDACLTHQVAFTAVLTLQSPPTKWQGAQYGAMKLEYDEHSDKYGAVVHLCPVSLACRPRRPSSRRLQQGPRVARAGRCCWSGCDLPHSERRGGGGSPQRDRPSAGCAPGSGGLHGRRAGGASGGGVCLHMMHAGCSRGAAFIETRCNGCAAHMWLVVAAAALPPAAAASVPDPTCCRERHHATSAHASRALEMRRIWR